MSGHRLGEFNLKAGDRVRCVKSNSNCFREGKVYHILSGTNLAGVYLYINDDMDYHQHPANYTSSLFHLLRPQPMTVEELLGVSL
jgi:hypothetical protein